MRVFYALQFTEETKIQLADYRDYVANIAGKGRYVPTENIHLTLAFIGEVGYKEVDVLSDILDEIEEIPRELMINQFGQFLKGDTGIVWVGIENNIVLNNIVKDLRKKLSDNNIAYDQKKFKAHITLGRQVLKFQSNNEFFLKPYKAKVASVTLMESKQIGGKLCYIPLEEKKVI